MRQIRICLILSLFSLARFQSFAYSNPSETTQYDQTIQEAQSFDCGFVPSNQVDRDKAITLYLRAVEMEPNNPKTVDLLLRVGQLYICNFNPDRGETYEPEKALQAFKRIFDIRDKQRNGKYWPKELSGLIFLGESYMALRQDDLAIETFSRFLSIESSQVEFAPHEWNEIDEKEREAARNLLVKETYPNMKTNIENHIRMVVGPLNDIGNYARLGMLQKQFPNADLLPNSPPPIDELVTSEQMAKLTLSKKQTPVPVTLAPAHAPDSTQLSQQAELTPELRSERKGTVWVLVVVALAATVTISVLVSNSKKNRPR